MPVCTLLVPLHRGRPHADGSVRPLANGDLSCACPYEAPSWMPIGVVTCCSPLGYRLGLFAVRHSASLVDWLCSYQLSHCDTCL